MSRYFAKYIFITISIDECCVGWESVFWDAFTAVSLTDVVWWDITVEILS
jgi:hypothetical protein